MCITSGCYSCIYVVYPAGAQWRIASAHLAAVFCTAGAVGASKVKKKTIANCPPILDKISLQKFTPN